MTARDLLIIATVQAVLAVLALALNSPDTFGWLAASALLAGSLAAYVRLHHGSWTKR